MKKFRYLFLVFMLISSLPAVASTSKATEVQQIAQAIDRLENLKNLELAKAARAEDQANRLQFQSNNVSDARRLFAEADTNKQIAARYQQEINKLKAQRARL